MRTLVLLLAPWPILAGCGMFSLKHYLVPEGTPVVKMPRGRKEFNLNPSCSASFYTKAEMTQDDFQGPLYYSAGPYKMQRIFIKDGLVDRVEIVRRNPWGTMDVWEEKVLLLEID